MNYLAHLLLAEQTAESLIGNLAGDFVKGSIGDDVPAGIAAGIRHHRRVDAFTDSHPSVAAFRRVLIPEHGHYARVIADVFFDHFLAIDFTRYASESLGVFLQRVYATIDSHIDELPGRLRIVYPRMRDDGWLSSYRTLEGIRLALGGISHRLSRRPQLATAVGFLQDDRRPELERLFHEFFPDVMALSSRP
ncbi:MAG TPA: ACP phosphodiesterase [Thermoanaerobaculia bacterium]|nr:ACP phosphodiesterase [Thermoanaerobaculia bacterium]